MLTNTCTGRSETAPRDATFAAICSFSCSPEHNKMNKGLDAIIISVRGAYAFATPSARFSGAAGGAAADNPCFGGKAPGRIEAVQVIDGAVLDARRILALAQRRRDARHHDRRDVPDAALGRPVDMAAEHGGHPLRMLQGLAQPLHHLRRFEVERVRPDRTSNGGWCAKTAIGLRGLGVDQADQALGPRGAEVALVAVSIERIDRDQPDRIILNRVFDEVGTGR